MQGKFVAPIKFSKEHLKVEVYAQRETMGAAAGQAVVSRILDLFEKQKTVTMVFAAAPSQNELLETLVNEPRIDWERIIAFHMDEYVGLPADSSQRFQRYLEKTLVERVNPGQVYFLNPHTNSPESECQRYAQLLIDNPIDIVCCGIGENGHLAFNDPPVADFLDPNIVKIVELDQACRQQQVNDGCFANLELVPTHALTLTITALLSARFIYCVVPGSTKAQAVYDTLFGPVSTDCPASILRRHFRSTLYLDKDSAKRLPNL